MLQYDFRLIYLFLLVDNHRKTKVPFLYLFFNSEMHVGGWTTDLNPFLRRLSSEKDEIWLFQPILMNFFFLTNYIKQNFNELLELKFLSDLNFIENKVEKKVSEIF